MWHPGTLDCRPLVSVLEPVICSKLPGRALRRLLVIFCYFLDLARFLHLNFTDVITNVRRQAT